MLNVTMKDGHFLAKESLTHVAVSPSERVWIAELAYVRFRSYATEKEKGLYVRAMVKFY